MSLTPSSQQLVVGGSVNYTLTVTPVDGFVGTVNFPTCGITPAGAGVTLSGCPSSLTVTSGPVTATLTASASPSATLQTYTINVTGASADAPADSRSSSATATTTDFSVSITPSSQTVISGLNGTFTVTVSPLNGFTGQVNISCNFSPPGPLFSGCPITVNITSGPASVNLTAGTAGIPLQTYTLQVTGSSVAVPADIHSATATMSVQPLILRPTTFTNFGLNGYSTPANAEDGNSGTLSAGPTVANILNEEQWSGFAPISGTPTQIQLKVTSAANCVSSSNDGLEIDYSLDGGNTNNLIYIMGLFGGPPVATRPLQTDVVSLPLTQNTANVTVLAMVYSQSSTGCHQIYDSWIEVRF